MKTGAQGLALIKHFEGFSAEPYQDVAGLWTVGYGHLIAPDEERRRLTVDEAEQLLRHDMGKAERSVLRLIDVALGQERFDALVCFVFNVGAGALQRSTLRRKVNRQEHDEVPQEFMRWIWAGGRRWPGLERRRRAEAGLYMQA